MSKIHSFFLCAATSCLILLGSACSKEQSSAEVASHGPSCNYSALENCKDFGGGQACYAKHSCSEGGAIASSYAAKPSYSQDADTTSNSSGYNSSLGRRLADDANRNNYGRSLGKCYGYVWSALARVVGDQINSLPVPSTSAYQFGDWVISNPSDSAAVLKLKRVSTSQDKAPVGSVIVWRPGQCGYSGAHGHIEIAIGNGKACSDFCQTIRTDCGAAQVFMPVN